MVPTVTSQCTTPCATCPGCTLSVTQQSTCPANSLTLAAGATSILNCTAIAGAYGTNGQACTLCPAGTYSSAVGATTSATCTSCQAGQYSTATGATAPCMACPVGQYCATLGTAPAACTSAPANSYYTSTATTASGCSWICNPGYYQSASTCVACPVGSWCYAGVQNTCPTNANSVALASDQNQCLCKAGYFGNGSATGTSPCPQCNAGSYCPGGNTNLSIACPANSTSSPGSNLLSQCYCPPGYQGSNGSTCALCPAGTICSSGSLSACPANTIAPEGSSSLAACVANPGFYQLTAGGSAFQCPANSYCTGGLNNVQCTANAVSPVQSISSSACYCDRGYQGVNNAPCVACAAGTWCWTGILNNCPASSNSAPLSSYMTNCTCNPGYSGPDGGPCVACLAGQQKPTQGTAVCQACGIQAYAPSPATPTCTPATQCPGGKYASPVYTPTSDNVCVNCLADSFCTGNALTPCPSPAVAPVASRNYTACRCPQGTFGVISSAASATCTTCPVGQFCPADQTVCACGV